MSDEDAFEFGRWETPFESSILEIWNVEYAADYPARQAYLQMTDDARVRSPRRDELVIHVYAPETRQLFLISFETVFGFRVLDEGGLCELWNQTTRLGGRPGQATFRARNHAWVKESFLTFLPTDGWSFFVATSNECVEVVSFEWPRIEQVS